MNFCSLGLVIEFRRRPLVRGVPSLAPEPRLPAGDLDAAAEAAASRCLRRIEGLYSREGDRIGSGLPLPAPRFNTGPVRVRAFVRPLTLALPRIARGPIDPPLTSSSS